MLRTDKLERLQDCGAWIDLSESFIESFGQVNYELNLDCIGFTRTLLLLFFFNTYLF